MNINKLFVCNGYYSHDLRTDAMKRKHSILDSWINCNNTKYT